ncbi:MAG: membrane-bound lytic murein transglycosylase MltF [Methylophilales bacterium]|nr:membrane-bound lytic murein transglycosylase MltF [Methylophilales bacterium]
MSRLLIIVLLTTLLAACSRPSKPLPPARQSHQIVVVTYNSPTTYYVNGNSDFAGIEYDLAKLFAAELSKNSDTPFKVKFLVVNSVGEVIPTLLKGRAHIAAAGLEITRLRSHLVRFGPSYQQVQPQLVTHKNIADEPHNLSEINGMSLQVPSGSGVAEQLADISVDMPSLQWREAPQTGSDELLEKVAEGTLDTTIADSHLVAMVQNYYPDLQPAFNVGAPRNLAWGFPKDGDHWLYQQADAFFDRIQKDGTWRNLQDRYYGHSTRLNSMDVNGFLQRMETTLPQYIKLMKEAEASTNIDWRLLAALSYQESHWDTFNTSPTNVRGLMMLTEDTADRMGVTNRLDPKQSIMAGGRYLSLLKDVIPGRIAEPDRTWMALAAYNVGLAHLEDARILAQKMKLNPDAWADVKKTLPLLNKVEHYSNLKFGFARGGAAVIFVDSIRTYQKILEKYQEKRVPPPPPPSPTWLPKFNLAWLGIQTSETP